MPIKTEAFLLNFSMYDDSTGALKTGLSPTAQLSKDGAAFAASANSVIEISGGHYKLQLTADEMHAEVIAVEITASGALAVSIEIVTGDAYPIDRAADAVWDVPISAHNEPGSFGKCLDMPVSKVGR